MKVLRVMRGKVTLKQCIDKARILGGEKAQWAKNLSVHRLEP